MNEKHIIYIVLLCAVVFFMLFASKAFAEDIRYCGIKNVSRSSSEVYKFKKDHPCPITGLSTGACKGWSVDHIIPLAVGGCDLEFNMQWLPNTIKSCAGTICKDRWERKIYAVPMEQVK